MSPIGNLTQSISSEPNSMANVTISSSHRAQENSQLILTRCLSLIRLRIRAAQVRNNRLAVASQQLQLQPLGRGQRNLILYGEDVLDLPIVGLRPKLKTVVCLDQFRADAYMVAVAPHTSLTNIGHAELPPHIAQVFVLALELKRRGTSNDLQA